MAQVIRIDPGAPVTYTDAIDRYLGSAGVADSSRRVYRISLTTWAWLLAGDQPPARRRGATPPAVRQFRRRYSSRPWTRHGSSMRRG